MKVLYYDCKVGISGDMHLGAMIDVGVCFEHLNNELKKLCIKDEFVLHVKKDTKNGISGTKVDVEILNNKKWRQSANSNNVRNYKDIEKIILESSLGENVKNRSLKMFQILRDTEARVHDMPTTKVHFHEVGAVDSIVDIVGAAICIEFLKPDIILSSKVELGGGFAKCEHGIIPVPAPATIEILKDTPTSLGLVDKESTTPTGAVILKANVDRFCTNIDLHVKKIGYGLGTLNFNVPNVLRVFVGEMCESSMQKEIIIETNIDDMNPEILSFVEEKLFKLGALDVYKCSISTKKNRLGVKLSVLCTKDNESVIIDTILKETTSIGIRKFEVDKIALKREVKTINTKFGYVNVKVSYFDNKIIKYKAEFEDCKSIAQKNGISIQEVYKEIDKVLNCTKN
ncbi:MAG: nickel pincer cofactor biosynthesis protein LarC [Campylobacteraceae bacterium]